MIKKTSYLLVISMTLILNSCKTDDDRIDITTGLQAYFPFTGNANDVSGNGFNGTVFGDAELTMDRNGNQNSAYEFDGVDDYINTFSTFDFESRTLSLWINPSNVTGSAGNGNNKLTHVAITQDDNDLEYGILRVGIDDSKLKLWAGGVDGTYTESIVNNQWYHLVLVRDSNSTKYYINGNFVNSGVSDGIGSTFGPNSDFIIGGGRSTTDQFFNGKIDEVRVYNVALNDDQIQELFKN